MTIKLRNSEELIKGLMEYLEDQENLRLLPEITKSLENEVSKAQNKDTIIVTSAISLSDNQLQNIKSLLIKKFKKDLPVTNKIDPDLIGGFTIKVNDWFLDSSIVYEIKYFKRLLLE